jgi:hypothetical protein
MNGQGLAKVPTLEIWTTSSRSNECTEQFKKAVEKRMERRAENEGNILYPGKRKELGRPEWKGGAGHSLSRWGPRMGEILSQ